MACECSRVYPPLMAIPDHSPPFLDSLEGRRAVVMGLGRFGGGVAVVRHLANAGASVLVTDLGTSESLQRTIDALDGVKAEYRLGEHRVEDFTRADLVVVNPAVPHPWDNPYLTAAQEGGARLLTEIRLAIGDRPAENLIGITGTAGKSTTAAMTHHVLARVAPDLDPRLSGNIGGSLLDDPPPHESTVVLELSSFMLHWLAGSGGSDVDRATPGLAAITNIAPNHLDWHLTQEHYAACKRAIGSASPTCAEPVVLEPPHADPRSSEIEADLDLEVPGDHNRRNAVLAIRLAIEHLRIRRGTEPTAETRTQLVEAIRDFSGLPHRLESLGEHRGVRIFNDSKSTTPEATLLAVEALGDPVRVHLIAGGYDKGSDLDSLVELSPRLAGLHAIGTTGPVLVTKTGTMHDGLEAAVTAAFEAARSGDAILLSPGCASWDQFTNFEERGEAFRAAVEQRRRTHPD